MQVNVDISISFSGLHPSDGESLRTNDMHNLTDENCPNVGLSVCVCVCVHVHLCVSAYLIVCVCVLIPSKTTEHHFSQISSLLDVTTDVTTAKSNSYSTDATNSLYGSLQELQ